MTKISSKTGNCPRIWMAPNFFWYLHAENVTQNKCVQKRKKSNSTVREPILMKFWHQIFWPQTVLTVPSDLHKTRLGPSYGPKRAEKMKLWKWLPGHFSRTFTQQKSKNILRGEFLDQYLPLVRVSRESGSGTVLGPLVECYIFSYSAS